MLLNIENIEKIIDSNQIFPIDAISLLEPILIPVEKIRSIMNSSLNSSFFLQC
jgi:hypothetical protein